jgi:CheY-like chemotaxis protein
MTGHRGTRVLVVDDQAGMRETLVDIFEDAGYQVQSAADGAAALRLVRTTAVDVMVLDVQMPVLDGFGVLDQLQPPPPQTIVMTAFATEDRLLTAMASNSVAVVHKPFSVSHLLGLVAAAASAPETALT